MKIFDQKKTFSQTRLEQAITLIVDEDRPIKEISIRCPYCGDSKHNPSKTHMGVKFGHPSAYHCFICDASGSVNVRFLKDMELDTEIIKKYAKYQKSNVYRSVPRTKEVKFNRGRPLYDFKYKKESPQYKYLTDRFKTEFTEKDIERFKIILDPIDFLYRVKRRHPEIDPPIDLSEYIGFLTQDNNQAVFRAIDKGTEPRFFNLTIVETNYRKLYVLDNSINIKSEKFNFVLTEGIFDLIGVYNTFYRHNENLDNTIFLAALGKSFQEPINRLIQSGFLDFDIYLFADTSSDVKLKFYSELFNNPYVENIYVAVNNFPGEKDFGVSSDKIDFEDFELFNRRKIKEMTKEEKYDKKKV